MNWKDDNFINKLSVTGPDSTVWIYQAPEPFTSDEKEIALREAKNFLEGWNTHGTPLAADIGILFNQFLVFVADQARVKASGCSIDSSVHLVKQIATLTGKDLFERQTVACVKDGAIKTFQLSGMGALMEKGWLTKDTPVFNNLINDLRSLRQNWIVPLKDSWHFNFADQNA